ncbi:MULTISPECIES: hypothetical protein [Mameliella]|uniref:hypothetical protein n=1 Tax=Mameliella TaxID=1434019 RepID=UPI000B52EAE9|nr:MULTISPECIES: hypothetical protein [Mameliella]MBV6635151.1 hypothetical protein [Mameliella sp.]MCR9271502.1 hypothetical protein [Paracoccaceae bacterium]MBY6121289.1 hypothetical protein [Mameliella alba]OWV41665.1 hypothetical protein CDZ95_16205 [Mameliella alba]OWV60430.1 hypothetical protein CDZ97_18090 [Mameliella alba]
MRPEYQNPEGRVAKEKEQDAMALGPKETATKPPFPKSLPEHIATVREALSDLGEATPEQVARQFKRGRARDRATASGKPDCPGAGAH